MRKHIPLQTTWILCIGAAIISALPSTSNAALGIADLAKDYRAGASFGDSSDTVPIPGTLAGSWHYWGDTDGDVTTADRELLTWKHQNSLNHSGNEYAGTNVEYLWNMPMLSAEALFDDPSNLPPAGSIMGHPSDGRWLAIEYRNDSAVPLTNINVVYRFEKPNTYGNVGVEIVRENGSVILPMTFVGASSETVSGNVPGVGTLAPGQSIWLLETTADGFAGDQTWLSMQINGVPEPTSTSLIGIGLVVLTGPRRRARKS